MNFALAFAIALVVILGLSYAWFADRARARDLLAETKRRGEDLLAEKQTERDLAVTATLTDVLQRFGSLGGSGALLHVLDEFVRENTVGVKGMIDSFREKCAVLDAATKAAQQSVAQAATEVTNIRAENTLHRTLLTKALSLPLDTPQGHRDLFLLRCEAVLESPRATFDCPNEDFWNAYVAKHKKAHEKGLSA